MVQWRGAAVRGPRLLRGHVARLRRLRAGHQVVVLLTDHCSSYDTIGIRYVVPRYRNHVSLPLRSDNYCRITARVPAS